MQVDLKLEGLDGVLETLKSLPPEVVSKRGGPVRRALRKGALVILKAEKAALQAVTSNATESGKIESTGFLLKNLVVRRGRPPAGENGELYIVRPSRKTYQRQGAKVSTTETARFLEYGTSKQPAEPWIRPAFEASAENAIRTVERELLADIQRVIKRLAAQNRRK